MWVATKGGIFNIQHTIAFDFEAEIENPIYFYFFRLSLSAVSHLTVFSVCVFAGRRGLEIRLHGAGSLLPVGFHSFLCGWNVGHYL